MSIEIGLALNKIEIKIIYLKSFIGIYEKLHNKCYIMQKP